MNTVDDIAQQANNFFSVTTPLGRIHYASSMVDDVAVAGTTAIANSSLSLNTVAKLLSENAGAIKAFAFIYDFQSQVNEGTSVTNAGIKTAAHVGISYAAG